MKKLLLTVLLGLGVSTCQADVLIYKIKVTATITGHGQTKKSRVTGYIVLDPNSLNLADISIQSASFRIFEFANASFAQIDAGKGKRQTALSFPGNGIGSVLATGINSASLITGTYTNYAAPKTLNLTGNEISTDLSTTERDSGTLIYDQTDTVVQNGEGGFDTVVSNIEQTLLGRGLIELH